MQQQEHYCFFTKNATRRMKRDISSLKYFDEMHSSYLLEISNKTGAIFTLNQKDLCVSQPSRAKWILNGSNAGWVYDEYDFGSDERLNLTMAKLSPCETLMAIVSPNNTAIIYLPDFLTESQPEVEANFEINEHNYISMEWSPLNDIYCAKKNFLTLDSSGRLRVHFVSGEYEILNLDENFHSATFSFDGGVIYAINYDQELCIIDPLNAQVISKRKIDKFGNVSHAIPTQMMQLTSEIMVIGSICKGPQEQNESLTPYLLVLYGDLLDPEAKLDFVPFQMSTNRIINPERLPDFRFHYIKERQILLFSHTESSNVQVLKFAESEKNFFSSLVFYNTIDGKATELDSLYLDNGGTIVRGFGLYRGRLPREKIDQMIQVEHQNREFTLPLGPLVSILDSEGFVHYFNFYDTRYPLPSQSMLVEPIKYGVLREITLVPTILANRSMIIANSFHWEPQMTEQQSLNSVQRRKIEQDQEDPDLSQNCTDEPKMKKGLFEYKGCSKSIGKWSDENVDNPYMLDCINETGQVLVGYGKSTDIRRRILIKNNLGRGFASIGKLDWMVESNIKEFGFYEYKTQEERGNIRMLRVSDCKYLVAMIYGSTIEIQKTNTFLELNLGNQQERKLEAEFELGEGAKYSYLEWPPLNHAYIEKPYFLTRDNKGILRIHHVIDKTEQVIGICEVFRCGTRILIYSMASFILASFALDGREIYAINEKQEICQIDLQESKIIMKRKINELSNPEEVISSHIQQLTPWTFAIGSMTKNKVENPEDEAILKPSLHIVYGDISDSNVDLRIKMYDMPSLKAAEHQRHVIFRSLFIKERQLLFCGHNGSNEIRVLHFACDGSQIEIDGLTLGNMTLRGMVFVKEARAKNKKQAFGSLKHTELLALDSKGYLHHFHYFDASSSVSILPKFNHLLSMDEFLKKQEFLKAKLTPKKRSRGKSQYQKLEITHLVVQKEKRSKSVRRTLTFLEACRCKEIQEKIKVCKNKKAPSASFKPAENPFLSLKKTGSTSLSSLAERNNKEKNRFAENPLLSIKKTESISLSSSLEENQKKIELEKEGINEKVPSLALKLAENPFLSLKKIGSISLSSLEEEDNKENKFAKNSFLSVKKAENTPLSNVFSADISKNNLFANSNFFQKEPETEAKSPFSLKDLVKRFPVPGDYVKMGKLFLNRLEYDITFKVEDQELFAHKSILSERCRFFKNMFASGMSESYSAVIEIPDIKASVFKAFLKYVYLGLVDVNEELAIEFYELSQRYMIDEVKESCENYLGNILTLDNCFRIFEIACLYETISLKFKTLVFFRCNLEKILERKDFEDLPKLSYLHIKRIQWEIKEITF